MDDSIEVVRGSLTPEHLEEITKGLRYRQLDRVVGVLWPLARQYGLSRLARDAGISRGHLYRLFGGEGSPEFNTILQLLGVFGVSISARLTHNGNVAL